MISIRSKVKYAPRRSSSIQGILWALEAPTPCVISGSLSCAVQPWGPPFTRYLSFPQFPCRQQQQLGGFGGHSATLAHEDSGSITTPAFLIFDSTCESCSRIGNTHQTSALRRACGTITMSAKMPRLGLRIHQRAARVVSQPFTIRYAGLNFCCHGARIP